MEQKVKTVVIAGAGPAGLTAAAELLKQGFRPVVLEETGDIGGISRTVTYRGNRMDIGGHRFFSKSSRVMRWWQDVLPVQGSASCDDRDLGRASRVAIGGPDPEMSDRVMLIRSRLSRILFLRKFFDYPVRLSLSTLSGLGVSRVTKIVASYAASLVHRRPERSLEDFFINRFGRELYATFFRDYTRKVWGVPCSKIGPDWGAQRVKGLSVSGAVRHALKSLLPRRAHGDLAQKRTETSLIEEFLYPKFGPGQLWETVAEKVEQEGGKILRGRRVKRLETLNGRVTAVIATAGDGEERFPCEAFFSSMPLCDLVPMIPEAPEEVRRVAGGLVYRDFITVGLLLRKLAITNQTRIPTTGNIVPDNWIYVQEPDVKLGRIQVFNNWSPYLVSDPGTVWLGLEYFCQEGDEMWREPDDAFRKFAVAELEKIGVAKAADVLDGTVVHVKKAYPAYFGTYGELDTVRGFLDGMPNLYCIGRNGQHRYNNQDHSMLTAMAAVDCLCGRGSKKDLWRINAEADYHESR